ncbi:MAG: sugar transferase, partial [Proteobacteria bacterium]
MRNSLASRKNRAVRMLWMAESILIILSVMAAAWIRFINDADSHIVAAQYIPLRAILVAGFITGAMGAFGLYQVHVRHNRIDFLLRLGLSFAFGGAGLLVVYYLIPQVYIGRGVLAMALVLGLVAVAGTRMVFVHLFRTDALKQRILVLGAGKNADLINSRMRRRSDRGSFLLLGFVPVAGQPVLVNPELQVNSDKKLSDLADDLQVDEIVIALDERRGGLPMEEMLACVQRGILVTDLSTFFEREAGMVQLNVVDPSWLVFSNGFDYSTPRRLSKRFFDLAAASLLLLIAWPLMLLVALCVWLEDGSPILYR